MMPPVMLGGKVVHWGPGVNTDAANAALAALIADRDELAAAYDRLRADVVELRGLYLTSVSQHEGSHPQPGSPAHRAYRHIIDMLGELLDRNQPRGQ